MTKRHDKKCPQAPRLRFPEFRDEWHSQALGAIASIIKEKVGNKKCTLMSIMTGVGLIPQIDKFGKEIAGDQYKNYIIIRNNDFAYNKSATKGYPQGFIALYTGSEIAAVPNSIFTCFKIQPESIVPAYLNYLFLGNFHGKWLQRYITVGARAHGSLSIDDDDLLSLPIPYPKGVSSLGEQQRIADCLSSLDERIAAETNKLDRLKDHKNGLLKQLFPAEGETLPQLRFPEFRDGEGWQKRFLDEYAEVVRGGSPRPIDNFLTTERDGLNWLKIGDINKEAKYVVATMEKVRAEALSRTREINPGDLILSNSMSFGRPYISKIKACIHDGWIAIKKISKKLYVEYIYYLISSPFSQQYFTSNAAGSGVQNLNADIIKSLPILFPNILEQQRIADCLSSLDALIASQTQKIDLLKDHKKGLMQQLFPCIDEVRA